MGSLALNYTASNSSVLVASAVSVMYHPDQSGKEHNLEKGRSTAGQGQAEKWTKWTKTTRDTLRPC